MPDNKCMHGKNVDVYCNICDPLIEELAKPEKHHDGLDFIGTLVIIAVIAMWIYFR